MQSDVERWEILLINNLGLIDKQYKCILVIYIRIPTSPLIKMQTAADIEIDSEAPYGRKKNGQPYKTKPSMRAAIQNYQSKRRDELSEKQRKYYAENTEKCRESIKKWYKEHPEKGREYFQKHYYDKKAELEYYRELFNQSLQTV